MENSSLTKIQFNSKLDFHKGPNSPGETLEKRVLQQTYVYYNKQNTQAQGFHFLGWDDRAFRKFKYLQRTSKSFDWVLSPNTNKRDRAVHFLFVLSAVDGRQNKENRQIKKEMKTTRRSQSKQRTLFCIENSVRNARLRSERSETVGSRATSGFTRSNTHQVMTFTARTSGLIDG